jgi:hypothetical protein
MRTASSGVSAWCALLTLCAAQAALATPSAAQPTMWRCGPDVRVFTDRPCADGAAVALARRPTPQALAEARAVSAREREAAERLAQERRRRHAEALRDGGGAAGIRPLQSASARDAADRPAAPTRRAKAAVAPKVE